MNMKHKNWLSAFIIFCLILVEIQLLFTIVNFDKDINKIKENNKNVYDVRIKIDTVEHVKMICEYDLERLLTAIAKTESSLNYLAIGDTTNVLVVGDSTISNYSYGLFQVKKPFYEYYYKGKNTFEYYKEHPEEQFKLHADLLIQFQKISLLDFAYKVQKPFDKELWTTKVEKCYENEL